MVHLLDGWPLFASLLALSKVDLDSFHLLEWRSSEFKLLNQVQNDEIQLRLTAVEYVYTEAIDCSVLTKYRRVNSDKPVTE